jgi:holo-[acyl-carrier protein] synthase
MNDPKINVGTDIIEVQRFRRKPLKSNMSFYNSIFTKSELEYCLRYTDPYPHLAGIFAAKESVIKCSSRQQLRMIDVMIVHDTYGKPVAIVRNKNKTIKTRISISHTRSLAIAVAIRIL